MRLLLTLILTLPSYGQILSPILFGQTSGAAAPCTPASGYSHCRVITIDHTQIPSTLTNFPVVAWNGFTLGASRIQNANCYDVIFTSDSAGTTKIPWEVESCNQSTGAMVVHFLDASASSTTDGTFYVSYDNASIMTAQNTGGNAPTAVWDSNFKGVWHLPNGTTLSGSDSTSNGSNLTTITGTVTATTGQQDGGASLGLSANYAGSVAGFGTAQSAVTVSGWLYLDPSYSSSSFGGTFNAGPNTVYLEVESNMRVQFAVSVSGGTDAQQGSILSTGVWYYVAGVYDGTFIDIYLNGALDSNTNHSQFTGTVNTFTTDQLGHNAFIGLVDEYRISNTARSANWIAAEYNNVKPSSTFVTLGTEH